MERKKIKKLMISTVLFLSSINAYPYCTDDKDSASSDSAKISIMTYNINGLPDAITKIKKYKDFESKKKRLANLCEFLKSSDLDAVMLQEVWLKKDAKTLSEACGFKYVCYQDDESFQSGLMILSNNYITNCSKKVFLDEASNTGMGSFIEKNVHKAFLMAHVTVSNGQDVTLITTHTISNYQPEVEENTNTLKFKQDPDEGVRLSQLKEIFDYVHDLDEPVVIGGDLNTGPGYPIWDALEITALGEGYSDDGNYEVTFSSSNKYVIDDEGSLDHFFVKDIDINKTVVLSEKSVIADSSDHYAKMIDVSICCAPNATIASK